MFSFWDTFIFETKMLFEKKHFNVDCIFFLSLYNTSLHWSGLDAL